MRTRITSKDGKINNIHKVALIFTDMRKFLIRIFIMNIINNSYSRLYKIP